MIYTIRVRGELEENWSDWLGECCTATRSDQAGETDTCLTIEIPDQPALFGILDQLRSLDLELVSLELIQPGANPVKNR